MTGRLKHVAIVFVVLALTAFSATPSLAQRAPLSERIAAANFIRDQAIVSRPTKSSPYIKEKTATDSEKAAAYERIQRFCQEHPSNLVAISGCYIALSHPPGWGYK
jgi:hypothetical protein